MHKINFDASMEEHEVIAKIVARVGIKDPLELEMDITATHCNGCPMDLNGLLSAPPLDFMHDIGGIRMHLDRSTGKLQNGFVPRYAAKAGEQEVSWDN